MERTCTIFKPSGHKLAELTFTYDWNDWATVSVVEFRQLYDDNDPNDESKSVYESIRNEHQHAPRQFASLAAIQAFDRDLASRELGAHYDLELANCRFEYNPDPVLLRYVISSPRQVVGLCDVYFSFIDNTKRAIFRSAEHPRFDMELTADSLETNFSCMSRFSLYEKPVIHRGHDITRLEAWY